MKIKNWQIQRIHALLPKTVKNDKELKAELIAQYTGNPSRCSTTDLNVHQATSLIGFLSNKKLEESEAANKMRRKILSICHEMDWHVEGDQLDWNRITAFNVKYGPGKKAHLNSYSNSELRILVTQYEKVLEHNYKKA